MICATLLLSNWKCKCNLKCSSLARLDIIFLTNLDPNNKAYTTRSCPKIFASMKNSFASVCVGISVIIQNFCFRYSQMKNLHKNNISSCVFLRDVQKRNICHFRGKLVIFEAVLLARHYLFGIASKKLTSKKKLEVYFQILKARD